MNRSMCIYKTAVYCPIEMKQELVCPVMMTSFPVLQVSLSGFSLTYFSANYRFIRRFIVNEFNSGG